MSVGLSPTRFDQGATGPRPVEFNTDQDNKTAPTSKKAISGNPKAGLWVVCPGLTPRQRFSTPSVNHHPQAAAWAAGKAAARPILTTEAAATLTSISRDSAERGLARLHTMGLVREITGGKRFRLWCAG